jgi:hypothetical protein
MNSFTDASSLVAYANAGEAASGLLWAAGAGPYAAKV